MAQSLESFTDAYVKLLVNFWSDKNYAERLESTPGEVAREAGLEIPEGVEVHTAPASTTVRGDVAEYHQEFLSGIENGSVAIVLPEAPGVETEALGEEDLAAVSGGSRACCCCPCSCCVEW